MNYPGRVRAASGLRVVSSQQSALSCIASLAAPSLTITVVAIAGLPI